MLTAGTLLRGYDENSKRFRPELSAIIARTPCEYLWENGLDKELRRAQALLDKKRLTVPTFHPLRESERTVELLDEKVRQRVAESFSAAASDGGGYSKAWTIPTTVPRNPSEGAIAMKSVIQERFFSSRPPCTPP